MRQYLDVMQKIMDNGDDRMTRNAVTRALFEQTLRFNMQDGFPAVTTKKLPFRSVLAELLWFLQGGRDTEHLKEIAGFNIKIWDGDAAQYFEKGHAQYPGDLGRIYGVQWRRWEAYRFIEGHAEGVEWVPDKYEHFKIDQIKSLIERLRADPFDRRLVVSAWNVGELGKMALPPCHMLFQLFATSDRKLSLSMKQRSADMFLGVPFNIASYALLLHMLAQVSNHTPWELIIQLGDAHIYHAHFDAVREQLTREPHHLPELWLDREIKDIDHFTMQSAYLLGYKYHPALHAPLLTKDVK